MNSQKTKVLLISHTCQSKTEGQPKAACLAEFDDIDLVVLSPDRWLHYGKWRGPDIPQNPGYRYVPAKVRWPWVGPAQCYLHHYPRLSRLLREFRPDIIDLWEEPWGLVSAQACYLRARLHPDARIVSETEQNIDKNLPFPFERFRSYTLRNADYLVARNQEAISVVRRKGYRGPAEVVPNAVDVDLFRPLDKDSSRKALGIDGFLVGYVGRIVQEKGLDDLLDALKLLPDDCKVVFVGDGPYLSVLQDRARSANLLERVCFISAQPLEKLPGIMNALHILALPSRTTQSWKEQFGRVLIEANACKTPVIGSSSGAIPEVVGKGGLVFKEGDAACLAESILQIRNNPSLAETLACDGYSQAHELYSWQRVAQRMRDIYLRCLGQKNPQDSMQETQG